MKLRFSIGLLLVAVVVLLGFAASGAAAQSLDDLTTVTTAADDVVSTVTEAASVSPPDLGLSGGGGGSGSGGNGGSEGGGGSLPGPGGDLLDGDGSGAGGGSGSGEKDAGQKSGGFKGSSLSTMSCGEAARDPRRFSAFLLTLKEGERGSGHGRGEVAGAAASGGDQAAPTDPVQPVLPPAGPDDLPTWFGLLALAALAFGLGAMVAITVKSSLAKS